MSESNGKWKFAFWIITVFTVIVGGSVVYNDRVRATEDQRVECKIDNVAKEACNNLASAIKEQSQINQEIKISLAIIQADVKYIKQGMK